MQRTLMTLSFAALAAATSIPQGQAQDLRRVLHAITEPNDARRYEEEAHHNARLHDEHYWQRYRAGLEEQRAHRERRVEEERYWHRFGEGIR